MNFSSKKRMMFSFQKTFSNVPDSDWSMRPTVWISNIPDPTKGQVITGSRRIDLPSGVDGRDNALTQHNIPDTNTEPLKNPHRKTWSQLLRVQEHRVRYANVQFDLQTLKVLPQEVCFMNDISRLVRGTLPFWTEREVS